MIQPLTTFVMIVACGVFALIIGAKLRLPSILFLLAFGVLFGPQVLGWIQPEHLKLNFPHYVSLMVALILFEGGSQLHLKQIRDISGSLRNLLSLGLLVTFIGVAAAALFLTTLEWKQSLLFGAMMTVSGPTVILPILKRVRVQENLHNLLKWEAILIDPIGVVFTVVLFEFLMHEHSGLLQTVALLVGRFGVGVLVGLAVARLAVFILSRPRWLRAESEELGGVFLLTMVFVAYWGADVLISESGLVSVTVAGIYFGNVKFQRKKQIDHFKDQVVAFALSILFVLIASKIPVRSFASVWVQGSMLLAATIFIVRPLAVWVSTKNDPKISWRERTYLAFMAPRGIVSASLATLFAVTLRDHGLGSGGAFLILSFWVIVGTIIFYSLMGPIFAWVLKVKEKRPGGVLIVGIRPFSILMAKALREKGVPVKMMDRNRARCVYAGNMDFEVYEGNAADKDLIEELDFKGVGTVVVLTQNEEANALICQTFSEELGESHVFKMGVDSKQGSEVPQDHLGEGQPILGWKEARTRVFESEISDEVKFLTKKMEEPVNLTSEKERPKELLGALFAIVGGQAYFLTASTKLPAGAELVCVPHL